MTMIKQRLDVPLKLKSVNDSGEFEGYGSVFGVKDCFDDIVVPGAFTKSLSLWREKAASRQCSGSTICKSPSGFIPR